MTNPVKNDTISLQAPLMQAISRVQMELHGAFTTTDEVNTGKYSYKYVSLPELLNTVTPLLAKHGLVALYYTSTTEAGANEISVQLHHIDSNMSLDAHWCFGSNNADFRASGAMLTYFYRRLLMGLLGIHPEDDDSESADLPKPANGIPNMPPPPPFAGGFNNQQQAPQQQMPPQQMPQFQQAAQQQQHYQQPPQQQVSRHVASAPPQYQYGNQ